MTMPSTPPPEDEVEMVVCPHADLAEMINMPRLTQCHVVGCSNEICYTDGFMSKPPKVCQSCAGWLTSVEGQC